MTSHSYEAIEPNYQKEGNKELRWSVFSLNLSVSGPELFVSIICKYRTLL